MCVCVWGGGGDSIPIPTAIIILEHWNIFKVRAEIIISEKQLCFYLFFYFFVVYVFVKIYFQSELGMP